MDITVSHSEDGSYTILITKATGKLARIIQEAYTKEQFTDQVPLVPLTESPRTSGYIHRVDGKTTAQQTQDQTKQAIKLEGFFGSSCYLAPITVIDIIKDLNELKLDPLGKVRRLITRWKMTLTDAELFINTYFYSK